MKQSSYAARIGGIYIVLALIVGFVIFGGLASAAGPTTQPAKLPIYNGVMLNRGLVAMLNNAPWPYNAAFPPAIFQIDKPIERAKYTALIGGIYVADFEPEADTPAHWTAFAVEVRRWLRLAQAAAPTTLIGVWGIPDKRMPAGAAGMLPVHFAAPPCYWYEGQGLIEWKAATERQIDELKTYPGPILLILNAQIIDPDNLTEKRWWPISYQRAKWMLAACVEWHKAGRIAGVVWWGYDGANEYAEAELGFLKASRELQRSN